MEDKKYSKLKAAFEATQPQVPADFTGRVMKRIEEQPSVYQSKRRRVWQYPIIAAVAASIVVLLTFHYLYNQEETAVEQPLVTQQIEQKDSSLKAEIKGRRLSRIKPEQPFSVAQQQSLLIRFLQPFQLPIAWITILTK